MAENAVDFERLRVDQLKKILVDRGVPCAGKRKQELVELAKKAVERYEVKGECDHVESEAKRRKIVNDDGSVVDLNGKFVDYRRDLQSIPKLTLGDVFAYLVKQCEWTPERLSKYKSDDGYLMYKDGHVEDVAYGEIRGHSQHCYLKGSVKPEQRQTSTRYETWALLANGGEIISGGCGCVAADDGSCKHLVALLYALVDFVTRHTDSSTVVGTDEACVWTKPRRASNPVKVEDLDFRRERKTPGKTGPTPKHYQPLKNVNIFNIQQHLRQVCEESHPGALFLKLVSDPPAPTCTVPSVSQLFHDYKQSSNDIPFTQFLMENTTDEHVEILQNLDQSSDAWVEARKGRITASMADSVRSVRDVNKCAALTDKILGNGNNITTSAIEFGQRNESVAREMYQLQQEGHEDLKVRECGLFILKSKPYLGASPDGIVTCSCHSKKLLEIKCSFKHRNIYVDDIPNMDPKYHLEFANGNSVGLKKSSPWYSQVQHQMGVTNMDSCDLVVFTHKGIKVIPIQFDTARWELIQSKAELIFINSVVPLL